MLKLNQKGAIPLLLLIAGIGLLVFIFITSTTSFKDKLFNTLFPKPPSHASETFNRFAVAGCDGGPNADLYCYNWNNMSEPAPVDQSKPAPNQTFARIVGKFDDRYDNLGCAQCTKTNIDQIFTAEEPKIKILLAKDVNKGGVWIVGNEANLGGSPITADIYAYQFKKYYDLIKSLDPSAKLANSGLLYFPNPNNPASTDPVNYLTSFLHDPVLAGIKPDIYNVHFYPGWDLNDQAFGQSKDAAVAFSSYVKSVDPGKPIWVTEFGVNVPASVQLVNQYMDVMINYFVTNPQYQRWFWFISNNGEGSWPQTSLLTPDGKSLTDVGKHYRELMIANGDSQTPTPIPTSTSTPTVAPSVTPAQQTTKFILSSASTVNVGQEIPVKISFQSDTDLVNLFSAQLTFPKDQLEITKIDTTSTPITNWVEQNIDNNAGGLSLIGAIPNPGFKTNGTPTIMATIIFKAKQAGAANINFESSSQMFRNSDNANIFSLPNSKGVTLSIAAQPTPTPTPTPTPKPTSTPTPVPTPTPTPTSTSTPTPTPIACSITSASWNSPSKPVAEGSLVNLVVNGQGQCNGKQVNLEVKKDNGILPADSVKTNPQPAMFIGNIASSPWVAEYTPNGPFGFLDPPNYYFNAVLEGSIGNLKSQEPNLGVQRAQQFKKGDGKHDNHIALDDMSLLLTVYSKTKDFPRELDINDDGVVNAFDFSSMLIILKQNGVLK